jgi:YbgC/YbaW family acyl-CoA thioester hydrolase
MYFDTAITDYWRALALPYEAAMHQLGGDLYVKKSSLEFHGSARFEDQLDIGLKCARIGNSSMSFVGGIFRGHDLLVTCELIYVFADPATQKSKPVPQALRDVLTGFEACEAMVSQQLGPWSELAAAARPVRTEVFLQEQHVPVDMEWDDDDETALHAVVTNRLGMPLATGRLLPAVSGTARIGRMAVSRVLRGSGLARSILQALMQAAAQRGDRQVLLHAQRSAEGFYSRLGFTPQGEPFDEAGIAHIEMVKAL